MICMPKNGATRRYVRRFAGAMSAYIALTLIVVTCFHRLHPTGPFAYLLAVLPAFAIIAMIVAVGFYLAEEKDEFQRNLFVQAMLWGLGGVMAVTSVWGMLESFTSIPHFEPTWTFSLFWILVGISSPFLQRRYR